MNRCEVCYKPIERTCGYDNQPMLGFCLAHCSFERNKMARCAGCRDDFYNGKNDLGVKECWNLKDAKLVNRVRVPVWQPPPYSQPVEKVYHCYHPKGYAMLTPEAVESSNRAARKTP